MVGQFAVFQQLCEMYLQSHVADSSYSLHVCSSVPRRCGEVSLSGFESTCMLMGTIV